MDSSSAADVGLRRRFIVFFPTGQNVISPHPAGHPDLRDPRTVRTMHEHVDVDTSGLLQREITMSDAGDRLLEMMMRTANGRLTAAEALGHREFVLTRLYESA
jgi:(2R)-sulfolactate sulfo-lyase subunit beta